MLAEMVLDRNANTCLEMREATVWTPVASKPEGRWGGRIGTQGEPNTPWHRAKSPKVHGSSAAGAIHYNPRPVDAVMREATL